MGICDSVSVVPRFRFFWSECRCLFAMISAKSESDLCSLLAHAGIVNRVLSSKEIPHLYGNYTLVILLKDKLVDVYSNYERSCNINLVFRI